MDSRGSPVLFLHVSAPLVLDAVCDIRGTSLGGKRPGTEVYDASVAVTMGWISAIGVRQHLHQNML